ncbi:MAG: putative molibdopterin-dependent oxidoreductase YjgC [Parasphingorhabdus sp.]
MTRKAGHRIDANLSDEINRGELVSFRFDDLDVPAYAGETVAAALIAAGHSATRRSRSGMPRGYFCGMGVCWECLVNVDGKPNQRACMQIVEADMVVQTATLFDKQ